MIPAPTVGRMVLVRLVSDGPEFPAVVLNAHGAAGLLVDVTVFGASAYRRGGQGLPERVEVSPAEVMTDVPPQTPTELTGWRWPPRSP